MDKPEHKDDLQGELTHEDLDAVAGGVGVQVVFDGCGKAPQGSQGTVTGIGPCGGTDNAVAGFGPCDGSGPAAGFGPCA